jgi:hypothetical protein
VSSRQFATRRAEQFADEDKLNRTFGVLKMPEGLFLQL